LWVFLLLFLFLRWDLANYLPSIGFEPQSS
jgi:hypothetical protein